MASMQLGKYEIRRQIGKGSMGVVYEAFDPLLQRAAAVKVIRDDQFAPSERLALLARLKREAQAAAKLSHPAIVAIYDYDELTGADGQGMAFIAMELIVGQELKALFDADHRFAPEQIERIMAELLSALAHAHAKGVTHRDIKPANVILLPNGSIKLADFGVARIDSSELTQTGMVLGTPAYMAPEQLLGLDLDGRADLFACGVLLYQFLTGTRPFNGSMATVIQKVLNEPAPRVSGTNPALVPAWDGVLETALAKKPQDRFQTAAAFSAAIRVATRAQTATSATTSATTSADHDDDRTVLMPQMPALPVGPRAPVAAPLPVGPGPKDSPDAAGTSAPLGGPELAPPVPAKAQRKLVWAGLAVASASAVIVAGASLWRRPAPVEADSISTARTSASAAAGPAAVASGPSAPNMPGMPNTPEPPAGMASAATPMAAIAVAVPRPASAVSARVASTAAAVAVAPAAASKPLKVDRADRADRTDRPEKAVPAAPLGQPPLAKPAPPAPTLASPAPAPPSAAPAPAAVHAAEWQAAMARLAGAGRSIDLAGALTLLLDVRHPEQQKRLLVFDRQVNLLKPYSALALGTKDGWLSFSLRGDRASVEQARTDALTACRLQPDVVCRTVQRGASFDLAGFRELAAGLGQRSVAEVRTRFIASLDSLRPLAPAPAPPTAHAPGPAPWPAPAPATSGAYAPPTPAPTPAPAPVPAPPAAQPARPASAWPAAVAALQQQRGQQDLGNALATLLQPDSDDDRQVFAKFDRMMKRLPWKSALAMGEEAGQLHYGYAWGEINDRFSADRALANCGRSAARSCVVVMSNGKFDSEALVAVAHRLGARSQAAVREAVLRSMRQSLASGR